MLAGSLCVRCATADEQEPVQAPFFEHIRRQPDPVRDIGGARVLAVLGDFVTTVHGLADLPHEVTGTAEGPASTIRFTVRLCIDTPTEADYYRHDGVLPYALRVLLPSWPPGGPPRRGTGTPGR